MRVRTGLVSAVAAAGLLAGGLAWAADNAPTASDFPAVEWDWTPAAITAGDAANNAVTFTPAVVKVWNTTSGAAEDAAEGAYTITYQWKEKENGTDVALAVTSGKIDCSGWEAGTYVLTATAAKGTGAELVSGKNTAKVELTVNAAAQPQAAYPAVEWGFTPDANGYDAGTQVEVTSTMPKVKTDASTDAADGDYTFAYSYKEKGSTAEPTELKLTEGGTDASKKYFLDLGANGGTYEVTVTATPATGKTALATGKDKASFELKLKDMTFTPGPELVAVPAAKTTNWWSNLAGKKAVDLSKADEVYTAENQYQDFVLEMGKWNEANAKGLMKDMAAYVIVFNKVMKGKMKLGYSLKDEPKSDNFKGGTELDTWSTTGNSAMTGTKVGGDHMQAWRVPIEQTIVDEGRYVNAIRVEVADGKHMSSGDNLVWESGMPCQFKILGVYTEKADKPVISWPFAPVKSGYDPEQTIDLTAAAVAAKVINFKTGADESGYTVKYYEKGTGAAGADKEITTPAAYQPVQTTGAEKSKETIIYAKATKGETTVTSDEVKVKVNSQPTAQVTWTVTTTTLANGDKLASTVFNASAKKADGTALTGKTFKYVLTSDGETEVDVNYEFNARYDSPRKIAVKAVLEDDDYIGESDPVTFELPILAKPATPGPTSAKDYLGSFWESDVLLNITNLFTSELQAEAKWYHNGQDQRKPETGDDQTKVHTMYTWNATTKTFKYTNEDPDGWTWDTWANENYNPLDWSAFESVRMTTEGTTVGTGVYSQFCVMQSVATISIDNGIKSMTATLDAEKKANITQFCIQGKREVELKNPQIYLLPHLDYATNLPEIKLWCDNSIRDKQLPTATLNEAKLVISATVEPYTGTAAEHPAADLKFMKEKWGLLTIQSNDGEQSLSAGNSNGAWGDFKVEYMLADALTLLKPAQDGTTDKSFQVVGWDNESQDECGYKVTIKKVELKPLSSDATKATVDNAKVAADEHNLTWEAATTWGTLTEQKNSDETKTLYKYYPVKNGTAFSTYKTAATTDAGAAFKYQLKNEDTGVWSDLADNADPFANDSKTDKKKVTIRAFVPTDAETVSPRLGYKTQEYIFKVNEKPDALNVVNAQADVVSVEFYNLEGQKVAANAKGLLLRVEKLANGKTQTTKVLVK